VRHRDACVPSAAQIGDGYRLPPSERELRPATAHPSLGEWNNVAGSRTRFLREVAALPAHAVQVDIHPIDIAVQPPPANISAPTRARRVPVGRAPTKKPNHTGR